MLANYTHFISLIFIALQFVFISLFFFEKNRKVKGFGSFTTSSITLMGYFISLMLLVEASEVILLAISNLMLTLTTYFLYKAFGDLLNLRFREKPVFGWLVASNIVVFLLSILYGATDFICGLGSVLLVVIPFVYLSSILSNKARQLTLTSEVTLLVNSLFMIIIGHAFSLASSNLSSIQRILNDMEISTQSDVFREMGTISLYWILFSHISLLICFLVFIYKRQEMVLLKQNETDFLTGVYNRKAFFEKVKKFIGSQQCYFILIDADHFKRINDTYGHLVGDDALKHIAKTVGNNISNEDLLARYGGEEFILAIANISEKDVINVVERIRSTMEANPLISDDLTIPITLSIGVSKAENENSLKDIEVADSMLYQAKNSGRNQAVFAF